MKKLLIILLALALFAGCNSGDSAENGAKGPDLAITTTTLPDAVYNQSYSATLEVAGGSGDYSFEIKVGKLPGSLALYPNQGIISGPVTNNTADAYYDFTIQVTDNETGFTASANLSILCNPTD